MQDNSELVKHNKLNKLKGGIIGGVPNLMAGGIIVGAYKNQTYQTTHSTNKFFGVLDKLIKVRTFR